jgi:hypothetical protein
MGSIFLFLLFKHKDAAKRRGLSEKEGSRPLQPLVMPLYLFSFTKIASKPTPIATDIFDMRRNCKFLNLNK